MKDLLDKLEQNRIHVSLIGSELKIRYDQDHLSDDLIQEIRHYKQPLISYLKDLQKVSYERIGRVAEGGCYRLSSSQRRIWVLSQFAEGGVRSEERRVGKECRP